MILWGQRALSAAAAAACLALCACGTSSSPAAGGADGSRSASAGPAGSASRSGTGTASHFCRQASSFMGKIPPAPTGHVSLAWARANLSTVLRSTVQGFSGLRAQGPQALRQPLTQIVGVYRQDEKELQMAGSITQLSTAMVKHNVAAAAAFEHLLKYIAANCR